MARVSNQVRAPYALDDIVDIAVAVFLEQGFDGTSMGDLALAAGITKSSLYHHVTGKEELFELGVGRALAALFLVLDEPDSLQGQAVDRIRHIIRRTVEIVTQRLAEVALLVRTHGKTAAEKRALDRRREFDRSLSRLVQQAIRDGSLRADLDPALFTRLALGAAVSVVEWYRPNGKVGAHVLEAAVEDLIFQSPLRGQVSTQCP